MADGQNNQNAPVPNAFDDDRVTPRPVTRKYSTIVKSINRHCDFITSPQMDNLDFVRSDIRYERLTDQWKELNELHLHVIDSVDDATADQYERTLAGTEDRYIESLSLLRIHIDSFRVMPNPLQAGDESSQSIVKQPIAEEVKNSTARD